jgi:hypothetical protein
MISGSQFVVHEFTCLDTATFDPMAYSRLKFGSDLVAREFGAAMADRFYRKHKRMLIADRCVVIPSAYNVVPIAASILAHHFANRLNDLLTRDGHRLVEMSMMHRTMSYIADYSFLPKEQREKLLGADHLYINEAFVKDKVILFVDDVTITGTHERKIDAFLKSRGLINPHIYCYHAKYNGERADIEAALNLSGINSPEAYLDLIQEPNHHLVVRALRFLLDIPLEQFAEVLFKLPLEFLERYYHACLFKEYDKQDGYREKFTMVRDRYDALVAAERGPTVSRLRA